MILIVVGAMILVIGMWIVWYITSVYRDTREEQNNDH